MDFPCAENGGLRVELTDYIRILRKHWPAIVAAVLLGIGVGAGTSLLQSPTYQATTRVFVSTQSGETSTELAQGNTYTLSRVSTYAELASTEQVLAGVVELLELDLSTQELASRITATTVIETTIIEIAATSDDAGEAADIANATATSLGTVVAQVESSSDGQVSPVRLTTVERATVPINPVSPRTIVNIALSGLVGLVLALALAVLREVLDTRIRSTRDLQTVTAEPLLGSVAFDPKARQRPLIVQAEPRNPRAEAYRAFRTNLQFIEVDGGSRTFVMTSSLPGEGKSTTSANLALVLADAGQTVLLIDADLRKPKVAEYLAIEGSVGLTDVLIGRVEVDDAVQKWGTQGFYVLPAGRIPPNPSELLGSKTMVALMEDLKSEFDWILIDAPPLLPVTDAAILATHASGAIVTVSAGRTTRHQLATALSNLAAVDGKVAGVVLTMVPTKGVDSYGYGYGYGYDDYREQQKTMTNVRHRHGRVATR